MATMPDGQEVQWTLGAVLTHLSALVEAEQPQCVEEGEEEEGDGRLLGGAGKAGVRAEGEPAGDGVVGSAATSPPPPLLQLLRRMARLSAGWVLLLCGVTSAVMCGLLGGALWWREQRLGAFGPVESSRKKLRRSASQQQISIVIRRW